jgi:hypothetical protein
MLTVFLHLNSNENQLSSYKELEKARYKFRRGLIEARSYKTYINEDHNEIKRKWVQKIIFSRYITTDF